MHQAGYSGATVPDSHRLPHSTTVSEVTIFSRLSTPITTILVCHSGTWQGEQEVAMCYGESVTH
jgi:hypothetical protein